MPDMLGAIQLDPGWQDWVCPNNCGIAPQRTRPLPPNASRFHPCPKVHGLTAPMVRAGTDATNRARLREDYEGTDHGSTQLAPEDDRPYMSLVTDYADGHNDAVVFAPVARARLA
jgi:hypothetical protein